jgi:hypothetical protein
MCKLGTEGGKVGEQMPINKVTERERGGRLSLHLQ